MPKGRERGIVVNWLAPAALMPYLASKGSVAVDGVSLTVNEIRDNCFGVNLIPYTLAHTSLGDAAPARLEIWEAGPVIATHGGPGAAGVFVDTDG